MIILPYGGNNTSICMVFPIIVSEDVLKTFTSFVVDGMVDVSRSVLIFDTEESAILKSHDSKVIMLLQTPILHILFVSALECAARM